MKVNQFVIKSLKDLLDNATPERLANGELYEEFWQYLGAVFCDGQCPHNNYPECCSNPKCFFMIHLAELKTLKNSDRKLQYHYKLIDLIEEKYLVKSEYRYEEEKNPQIYKQEAMEIASDMYDAFEGGDE